MTMNDNATSLDGASYELEQTININHLKSYTNISGTVVHEYLCI